MTISTTAATGDSRNALHRRTPLVLWLLLPAVVVIMSRRAIQQSVMISILLLLVILPACSGVSSGGSGGGGGQKQSGTPPGTYAVTITGTSPGAASEAAHSAQVTLVVN
jgi:hypothetical protein